VHELENDLAVRRMLCGEDLLLTSCRKRMEIGEARELPCEPAEVYLGVGHDPRSLLFLEARHAKSFKTHEA